MPLESLIERIDDRCGNRDAEAVAAIFDGLKQPLPEAGQFRKGHESDTVFLNKLGLVFRVSYASSFPLSYGLRHNKDPLIAQPLRSPLDLDDISFEILPALDCTEEASESELSFLIDNLGSRGVNFWDTKKGKFNTGKLPWRTKDFPDGIHVVTDRGGIRPQADFTMAVQNHQALEQKIPSNIQETLFARFIDALSRAWPEGQESPDPSRINEFLELCQEDIERPEDHPDKALFSGGWGMHSVQNCADRYERGITI